MLILQLCKSTAYYRNGYMNNYCVILSKVRKRRLNWREWKNMTVQASVRDPGLRSPGRQKSREDADLGVHLNHSMVRSTHRATDKLCLQVGIPEWKKRNIWYISIHINTYQYISCIPEKYRKKAVLARSLRHKSLGTLLRNPNEQDQHNRL